MTKREKQVKRKLQKMNWFRDYYYIMSVIESCTTSTSPVAAINAKRWGTQILDSKIDYLVEMKGVKKDVIYDITLPYKDNLRLTANEIVDKIIDRNLNNTESEQKENNE